MTADTPAQDVLQIALEIASTAHGQTGSTSRLTEVIAAALTAQRAEGVREERERCAKMADEKHDEVFDALFKKCNAGIARLGSKPFLLLAAAIRAAPASETQTKDQRAET